MIAIRRDEALDRLNAFLPQAGASYAKRRNYDYGPDSHQHVSQLSAALRRRTLHEQEVVTKTLIAHSFGQSEKFIQEVFWRTYWKGWLEMRPTLWDDYVQKCEAGFAQTETLEQAMTGTTGIACFDFWHEELTQTNYLHNHARMWFASIWIHTLSLPWQAGAALFMHHLIDGDPASNTLGWRWVAGLQTRGKAYAARADNIDQFTNGRFAPYGALQEDVAAIEGPENPPAMTLRAPTQSAGNRPLLVVTAEDCLPETLPLTTRPIGIVRLPAGLGGARAPAVLAADEAAMTDALARGAAHYNVPAKEISSEANWQEELQALQQEMGASHHVMAYQPVGAWRDVMQAASVPVAEIRRGYDEMCWPHAKKGFFPFKEKIPSFISQL